MSPPPIDERDVSAIREVPGVLDIATATQDPAMAVVLADSGELVFEPAVVTRVSETFFEVNPKPIFAGSPPESADEVIIGPTVANSVYPELAVHEVVGLPIELGRQSGVNLVDRESHTISGVFAPRPWESFGDIFDGAIVRFVRPSDPPMTASTGRDLHIRIDLTADYGAVLDDIRAVVDARHEGFGAAVIHEPAGDLSLIRDTMTGVGRAWVTMAWISLMVGGAGLASVVIVRLVRSRSELALRRAMGATQVRVAALSTSMALRIAGYASLVGLILAAAVTYWVTTIAPWRFHWPVTESITALLVALIVSLAAVIVPVLAFSRLPPWSVLKEE